MLGITGAGSMIGGEGKVGGGCHWRKQLGSQLGSHSWGQITPLDI